MPNRVATTDRVYAALKAELLRGRRAPGTWIDAARISDRLGASMTPVREAINRLIGEHLLESQPHGGVRVPPLSEAVLRSLYAWHADLVLLSLRRNRASGRFDVQEMNFVNEADPSDLVFATRSFFDALVIASDNPAHLAALRSIADRLEPVRYAEPRCFADGVIELSTLTHAFEAGEIKLLKQKIGVYHRRRIMKVHQILRAMFDDRSEGE